MKFLTATLLTLAASAAFATPNQVIETTGSVVFSQLHCSPSVDTTGVITQLDSAQIFMMGDEKNPIELNHVVFTTQGCDQNNVAQITAIAAQHFGFLNNTPVKITKSISGPFVTGPYQCNGTLVETVELDLGFNTILKSTKFKTTSVDTEYCGSY